MYADLIFAVVAGRVDDLTGLLQRRDTPVSVSPGSSPLGGFAPLLHVAVVCGQLDCAAHLVHSGADAAAEDAFGWSALGLAWLRGGIHAADRLNAAAAATLAPGPAPRSVWLDTLAPDGSPPVDLSTARIIIHPRTGGVVLLRSLWPCAGAPPPLRGEDEWEAHIAFGVLATHRGTASPPSIELLASSVPRLLEGGDQSARAYADISVSGPGGGVSYSVSAPIERRSTDVWAGPPASCLESHRALLIEATEAGAPTVVAESLWAPGGGLVFPLRGTARGPPPLHLTFGVSVGLCGGAGDPSAVGVALLTPAILDAAALGDPSSSFPRGIRHHGEAALPVVEGGGLRGYVTVRWALVRGCTAAVLRASTRDGPSAIPPALWRTGGVWGHRGSGMDGTATVAAAAAEAGFRRQHVAENSLGALTLAQPLGAAFVEFDVQVRALGVPGSGTLSTPDRAVAAHAGRRASDPPRLDGAAPRPGGRARARYAPQPRAVSGAGAAGACDLTTAEVGRGGVFMFQRFNTRLLLLRHSLSPRSLNAYSP